GPASRRSGISSAASTRRRAHREPRLDLGQRHHGSLHRALGARRHTHRHHARHEPRPPREPRHRGPRRAHPQGFGGRGGVGAAGVSGRGRLGRSRTHPPRLPYFPASSVLTIFSRPFSTASSSVEPFALWRISKIVLPAFSFVTSSIPTPGFAAQPPHTRAPPLGSQALKTFPSIRRSPPSFTTSQPRFLDLLIHCSRYSGPDSAACLLRECLFVAPHVFSETVLNDLRLTPSVK